MKALNTKERNSSIFKFSMWLLTGVLIICVPIIFSSFLSKDQGIEKGDKNERMATAVKFEREYIAVKIQEIINLMESKSDAESDAGVTSTFLGIIYNEIKDTTKTDTTWRGKMYRNIVTLSGQIVRANNIESDSGGEKEGLATDLNDIIAEIQKHYEKFDNLSDGSGSTKKKIRDKVGDINADFKASITKLNNLKGKIQ